MIATEVQKVKNKLVNIALAGILVLIVPVLIGSISRYSVTGLMPLHFIQFGSTIAITFLYIFRKKINFVFRAHGIIVVGFLSGFGAIYSFGLAGATDLVAGSVILAAVFFDKKMGFRYLILAALIFFLFAIFYVQGIIIPISGPVDYFLHYSSWVARGTGIIMVLYVIVLSIGKFNELFINALGDVIEKGKSLKLANDAMSDILQFLPVPIGISNNQGEITFLNEAFEKTFEYTIYDIPTLSAWYEKAYPETYLQEEYKQRWKNDSDKIAYKKEKEPLGHYRIQCKNGNQKHVLLYSKKLDEKVIVALIDVTEQYNAEEALRYQKEQLFEQNQEYQALNEELNESNEQIQTINQELVVAKNKAQESDRLKSAFLANISHEIRTPMNGIIGFAGLLSEPDVLPEKRGFYIDIINSSSHRLLKIVNDVLDISKIEAGLIDLHFSNTNLNKLFNELNLFYRPQAKTKKIELRVIQTLPDNEVWVKTDKTKLYQILDNLLNNAVKFTKSGSITLQYKKSHQGFLFEIEDTGIGIELAHQKNIFQRFYQGIDHTRYEFGGTGLGLSIAQALVDVMGGIIKVDSEIGKGSRLYFELPLNTLSGDNTEMDDIPLILIFDGLKTILVVEDEELYFQFLNSILCNSNIKILHAENGKRAIELVHENPSINLVLMDIHLPDISGFEAAHQIKKFNMEIPVVALTGYDIADYQKKAINIGFSDYLTKPMNKNDLLGVVKKFLG